MDVSIIIVNYNTSELIINCIKSILKHVKNIDYEIIVVDNNSEKDIPKILKEEFPSLIINCILLDQNVGFGLANNEGAKRANGRNLFFLNPDTILLNDAINILSQYLDSNASVGICGGNLYDKEGNPYISFRRLLPGIMWELNTLSMGILDYIRFGKNRHFNNTPHPLSVGYIVGADLMIRSSLFRQIGGFSKNFFMYYEETDLCHRIKEAGYSVIALNNSKIIHLEGKSFQQNSINEHKLRIQENSKFAYYKKNMSNIKRKFCYFIYNLALFVTPFLEYLRGRKIYAIESNIRKKIIKDENFN